MGREDPGIAGIMRALLSGPPSLRAFPVIGRDQITPAADGTCWLTAVAGARGKRSRDLFAEAAAAHGNRGLKPPFNADPRAGAGADADWRA